MRLQKGNRKLPKSTLIWNLPSGSTCPNATKECLKHCYAKKAERLYPQVTPFREQNYLISKDDDFPEIIEQELALANFDQIRPHESGDFYSQEYFDKWVEIAKKIPDYIIYAYTKNIDLDTRNKPDNFILILSKDDWIMNPHPMMFIKFDGIATVDLGQEIPNKDKYFVCQGDCKTCSYCYTKSKKPKLILFPKH